MKSVEKCGVWPFEQEKVYQDFIIGGDADEPELFSVILIRLRIISMLLMLLIT